MRAIALTQVCKAIQGRPLRAGVDAPEITAIVAEDDVDALPEGMITGVTHDNREVRPGDLFFAFPGERFDGHDFVEDALDKGAVGCVVSKDVERIRPDKSYLRVEDTVKAYGALAAAYRAQFHLPVVGITGSVGKTTTKDMIASVLSQKFQTVATKGNLNNHIGLPTTVFRMDDSTEAAVLEMGMNHFGEISYLTDIARPTIVTITNVGDAHIGILGSRENIFKAKSEIFEGLSADGLIVLNVDDALLRTVLENDSVCNGRTVVTIGEGADAQVRAVDIEEGEESLKFRVAGAGPSTGSGTAATSDPSTGSGTAATSDPSTGSGTAATSDPSTGSGTAATSDTELVEVPEVGIYIPLPGRHLIYPALTAYAIGRYLGLTEEEIVNGIAGVVTTGKRMEIEKRDGNITILNDTYNANPQSMKAALKTLSKRQDVKRIAVLGDMYELGEDTVRLHREVGEAAVQAQTDVLVTVGELALDIAEGAGEALARDTASATEVITCKDKEEAKAVLARVITPDSAVLFKASRGMRLEELVTPSPYSSGTSPA